MKFPRLSLRFSLLTLLLAVLLVGSVGAIYVNRVPWRVEVVLDAKKNMLVEGFSPSGKYLLAGGSVWDARTGKVVLNGEEGQLLLPDGKLYNIRFRNFLPKSDFVVSSEPDSEGRVYVFDVSTHRLRTTLETSGKFHRWRIEFSPDETLIWMTTSNYEIVVRNAATGKEVFRPDLPAELKSSLNGDGAVWTNAAFSPDSSEIAAVFASSSGQYAAIWDISSGRIRTQLYLDAGRGDLSIGSFIEFTPDGQTVILADSVNTACIIDTRSGELRARAPFDGLKVWLRDLQIAPDGKSIVTTGACTVNVLDLQRGRPQMKMQINAYPRRSDRPVASYSPDGRCILASGFHVPPSLWDSTTGERIFEFTLPEERFAIACRAAFSPDGRRVAASSDDATRIWKRVRPEEWWGVAWLPEFWMSAAFAALLVGNIARNARRQGA